MTLIVGQVIEKGESLLRFRQSPARSLQGLDTLDLLTGYRSRLAKPLPSDYVITVIPLRFGHQPTSCMLG
jgi:hypothetical protein